MRASSFFLPTLREDPREAHIASHRLMLRAGMIQQLAAGLYVWLPYGLKVLQKIQDVIRREQAAIGALEMLAPTLQPESLWQESGRYNDYGKEMLRVKDCRDQELIYGPTSEEVFTHVIRSKIHSHHELPKLLYNIQWKFRDEKRPRFGVMRSREFLMKDGYSFDLTPQEAKITYQNVFQSYMRTFQAMNLKVVPLRASTGAIGGDLSHEFHVLADTGEGELFYDRALDHVTSDSLKDYQAYYAMADDQHDPANCPLAPDQLQKRRGIEVGHIFYFGTKYSKALKATVPLSDGQIVPMEMGSYGIGVSRLVGALIEAHHDEHGIKWPLAVAPFGAAIIGTSPQNQHAAQQFYSVINRAMDCFLYDTEERTGALFAQCDLLGFPYRIVFGKRWELESLVEVKERATGTIRHMTQEEVLNFLTHAHKIPHQARLSTLGAAPETGMGSV